MDVQQNMLQVCCSPCWVISEGTKTISLISALDMLPVTRCRLIVHFLVVRIVMCLGRTVNVMDPRRLHHELVLWLCYF
jgi:hypothetical protein